MDNKKNRIMTTKCSLDSDQCLSLWQILSSFHSAINEEQSWALCYQCVKMFIKEFNSQNSLLLTDSKYIYVSKDGSIHPKTLKEGSRPLAGSEDKLIASLGVVLFHALDYGLCEDEERSLSKPLELLIEKLTSAHNQRPIHNQNINNNNEIEDEFANDEGIERDCGHEDNNSIEDLMTFDKVIQICVSRLSSLDSAESHYRAVCRALVAETLELSTFLDQIAKGTKELRKSSVVTIESNNELNTNLDELGIGHWARLWIQVIRELRNGVKLKKVQLFEDSIHHHLEFELTPYEMLLDDIRSRRYKLNKVMVNGDLPPRVKKDAHALILDFIRSRPPLVPVSKRVLGPAPLNQQSLYEKLMQSIRQQHKLRPTPPSSTNSTPIHRLSSVETSRTKITDNEITPAPRRRLIKADLTLRLSNSFDDEEDNDIFNANESQVFHKPEEEESLSLPTQPEKKSRRFSLRNLSLRLLSHERRHSISVCESPLSSHFVRQKSDEISDLDVNEDTRQHVASIWESHDWGRALECLSLTLEEVQHIRSVLTKAEIETLAVTKSLRDDLENGKICFTCLKTRFSFWGPWPQTCKLCERSICERCSTKMHIPTEHFEKVPIYMLSPTPSPPAEEDKRWPERSENEPKSMPIKQMEVSSKKKSRLMKVLTLNRDKDIVLVDSSNKKMGPLVRVCRDCKILVRHLIDIGKTNFTSTKVIET